MNDFSHLNQYAGMRIAVAMSGGVDSSTAAWMLRQAGAEVVGITMLVCDHFDSERVKKVTDLLSIEHHFIDLKKEFEKTVIQNFIDEYSIARTPNPCALCNEKIKFGILMERAFSLGCSFLATGHYCSFIEINGNKHIAVAKDLTKNQEYFLARLRSDHLNRILFPLSSIKKSEIKEIALEIGLDFIKGESQEICFIADNDYKRFLMEHSAAKFGRKGLILGTKGNILGEHNGIENYTIGQRKGICVRSPNPLHVVRIDMKRNVLIVGPKEETYKQKIIIKDIVWTSYEPSLPAKILAKIRYKHDPQEGTLMHAPRKKIRLELKEPVFAPTPGQLAAFYHESGGYIIGSGWIESIEE